MGGRPGGIPAPLADVTRQQGGGRRCDVGQAQRVPSRVLPVPQEAPPASPSPALTTAPARTPSAALPAPAPRASRAGPAPWVSTSLPCRAVHAASGGSEGHLRQGGHGQSEPPSHVGTCAQQTKPAFHSSGCLSVNPVSTPSASVPPLVDRGKCLTTAPQLSTLSPSCAMPSPRSDLERPGRWASGSATPGVGRVRRTPPGSWDFHSHAGGCGSPPFLFS